MYRYHSHISSQYGNGIVGSIVINGPASANYDIDLGVFPITDWYLSPIDQLFSRVNDPGNPFIPGQPGSPPTSDNMLFNGTNINPTGPGGYYGEVVLTKGLTHRVRLINPSADTSFTVSIAGHKMTIIQTDFVPIVPTTVDSIFMSIGQRYDILLEANADSSSYWLNVTFSSALVCGGSNNPHPAGIVRYSDAPDWIPADPGTPPVDSFCADSNAFTPVVSHEAPSTEFQVSQNNTLSVSLQPDTAAHQVLWTVNSSAIDLYWDAPTLQYVLNGNTSFMQRQNIIDIPNAKEVRRNFNQSLERIQDS
jgi:FtsP/CotA-like multicopper oxidase with cupredoxin domain